MESITEYLSQPRKKVLSIIGSGGKSTLMWHIANNNRHRKTLVTTTTKIKLPDRRLYDRVADGQTIQTLQPLPGITVLGNEIPEGKLQMKNLDLLQQASQQYDLVLIEADGSKRLPLKGWAEYEPVVPPFTTDTVGVVPLWALGWPIDEEVVHRVERFCRITGGSYGQEITLGHIVSMVSSPEGLFQKAVGNRILFLNQIENQFYREKSKEFTSLLPPDFIQSLESVVAGSAQQDRGEFLWRKQP